MQSLREAERIIRQWEDAHSSPPEHEDIYECCMCPREAEYEVDGDYYCEHCLLETFRI